MATAFKFDSDAAWADEGLDDLPEGDCFINGRTYRVTCPKDTVGMVISRAEEKAQASGADGTETVLRLILDQFIVNEEDIDDIVELIHTNRDFQRTYTLEYFTWLLKQILDQYEPIVAARREKLGIGEDENPNPATRVVQGATVAAPRDRQVKKAPAKKTARKRVAR